MTRDKPKCPTCGSESVAAIQFGYPGPEMMEEAQRGDIVLGGCCVTENDPEWHCKIASTSGECPPIAGDR